MNAIFKFFRFLCCKENKPQMNSCDDISNRGEWYNEWDKEFDKLSSLREKHAKFYSSIPNIEKQGESQPEQYVS